MIAISIVVLGLFLLAGVAALIYAAKRAPEGYEGPLGFQEGVESQPPDQPRTAMSVHSNKARQYPCPQREMISSGRP